MTTIRDLPRDMVREIFSRVPLTSLKPIRYTCRNWNALSKNQILGKAAITSNQFLGFLRVGAKVCSIIFDLQGIRNNDFVDLSIKQISILDEFEIYEITQCDGLLLCILGDKLMVLNPYLGQTRWIELKKKDCNYCDKYVLGYDSNKNHNHKILRIVYDPYENSLLSRFEIYDFSSNLWRVLDVSLMWVLVSHVTLKGNGYFCVRARVTKLGNEFEHFLICFDFTTERFGPRLTLPFLFIHLSQVVVVSCVGEEKHAVLYQDHHIMNIWITTKIEPNVVLWGKFLNLDMTSINGYYLVRFEAASFFTNEEKKVAVVSSIGRYDNTKNFAYIIGQDGYFKSVEIGEHKAIRPTFSSFVPSLVQLRIKQQGKRKERD